MAFAITHHICWGTLKNICVLILENVLLNAKSVITRVAKKKTWKNIWCYIDDKHLINRTYLKDLKMSQFSFTLRLSLFIILFQVQYFILFKNLMVMFIYTKLNYLLHFFSILVEIVFTARCWKIHFHKIILLSKCQRYNCSWNINFWHEN